jgi:hypothetical protein
MRAESQGSMTIVFCMRCRDLRPTSHLLFLDEGKVRGEMAGVCPFRGRTILSHKETLKKSRGDSSFKTEP